MIEVDLRQIEALLDLGRYDDAELMLERVLADDPSHERGLTLLGRALFERHDYRRARAVYRRLVGHYPDSWDALTSMAKIEFVLRNYSAAEPYARRAVAAAPHAPSALWALAAIRTERDPGSPEGIELFERILELNPHDEEALEGLSSLHFTARRWEDAQRWTLRRLEIAFGPVTMVRLGMIRGKLGRFEESRDAVRAALRTSPQSHLLDIVIGSIESFGIPEHLAEIYRSALAARDRPDVSYPGAAGTDPKLLAAQAVLARVIHDSKFVEADGSVTCAELAASVLAVLPDEPNARYVQRKLAAAAALAADKAELADATAKQVAAAERLLADGAPDAREALYHAHSASGDHTAAFVDVEASLRAEPDSVRWLCRASKTLRSLGENRQAASYAGRAVEFDPNMSEAYFELGMAAWADNDIATAEQALRRYADLRPDEGMPTASLAVVLGDADRWDEVDALVEQLKPGMADGSSMVYACSTLFQRCRERVDPQLFNEAYRGRADTEGLVESAEWLQRLLVLYPILVALHPDGPDGITKVYRDVFGPLHRVSHEFSLPESSPGMQVLRRYATQFAVSDGAE